MISLWWWYLQGYNWNGFRSHLGPWLFWSLRNLVPKKFGPREIWALLEKAMWWFSCGDQISWGSYFLGTKLLGAQIQGPNEIGVHFSYSHFVIYVVTKWQFSLNAYMLSCPIAQKILNDIYPQAFVRLLLPIQIYPLGFIQVTITWITIFLPKLSKETTMPKNSSRNL